MGKSIERILLERGHEVVATFGSEGIDPDLLSKADVAIEFSLPETAYQNICSCFKSGIPVVTGTTGWLQNYEQAIESCQKYKGGFIYASNYSLGVNLFFELNKQLTQLLKDFPSYTPSLQEIHHIHKKDAPSGTAISLAEDILAERKDFENWALKEESKLPSDLSIEAIRENETPGTHSIRYESAIDTIEIKHTAHSRQGFALGAVIAAEYLNGKSGVYSMRDVLNLKS